MKPTIIFIAYAVYVMFGLYLFDVFVPLESRLFMPVLVVFGASAGVLAGFALSCFEK